MITPFHALAAMHIGWHAGLYAVGAITGALFGASLATAIRAGTYR